MILIQKNHLNLPYNIECASALYGAMEMDIKWKLIDYSEIEKYDDKYTFIGTVEFMNKVFKHLKIDYKKLKNSNRESQIMTLNDALKIKNVFIKPLKIKLFTGLINDGCIHSCLEEIDHSEKVYVYPVIKDIISEWRCYIERNEIIDIKNYSGEFNIYPNIEYVKEVIKENKDFPNIYTIDIGIRSNNENFVVEFNDMFSIGNYGLDNYTYLRLLMKRFNEIKKKMEK